MSIILRGRRFHYRFLMKGKEYSGPLSDPFLSLAFITLPVIPFLKLTDRGMFDTVKFSLLEQ